jgi:tetratricopeptide (TPR) repeat protein
VILSDPLLPLLDFPVVQHGLLTDSAETRYMFCMPLQGTIRIVACVGIALLPAAGARSNPNPADKADAWVEVTTPHFSVMSDDGEKTARRIADQFEQIRSLYSRALSRNLRLDPGIPILIVAARNEKSLSQLIPEYWAEKGHTHPAGIFVAGAEKNFIALRTDAQGEFPYLTIYHEYVHLIVSLNFQHFPLWLNEGFATFFGSATVAGKAGKLGQPNASELFVLSQTKLLPLDVLFRVGHDSPYYNEAEKTNIFYAESWALVHYLMTDDVRKKKENQIDKYIGLVEGGGDPVDSAKLTFGDLGRLKKELDAYASRTSFAAYAVDLPEAAGAKPYSVRAVPRAEAVATLGEFDIGRGQLEAARSKMEEAIRLDPNLAATQEGMGLIFFRENRPAEAQKYFSQAAALNSKSALTYYYDGMLLLTSDTVEEDPDEARDALEKAVALKPELAPAWDALATLYAREPATLPKAVESEERAVKTMPGEPRYQFNLGAILLRAGFYDDARAVAQRVTKSGDRGVAAAAADLLRQIDRVEENNAENSDPRRAAASPAGPANTLATGSAGTNPPEPVLRKRPSAESSRAASDDASGPAPEAPAAVTTARPYSMIGTVAAIDCATAPQMQITLQAGQIVMHLHASNIDKVEFKGGSGSGASGKAACGQLRAQKARISYQLVAGKAWDGEILSIELQASP